ncbi:MAG: restriction endonuclease subunit S [Hominenteromicrobium sp.]|uniref:restriction endonuclease subunit S n=1 Tax=Hominenteromicrobium sp. TaxID=3073581 RepID=UPI0039995EF2
MRKWDCNVPTLRFAEFTDEWGKYELSHFVTRITRRNKNNESSLPLTISAQYGLVDQISFFNKTVASVDLSGYYLLYNGDFAYNKSYSNDYAWGAVKRLDKYEKGCLSSLYFVFRPNDNVDSDYLTHYFESSKWHKGISNIAGEGARNHGLLNMAIDDYFATKHYLPSLPEQKKIAQFFNAITRRIEIQNKIISKYETLIKGIRHRVFVSICDGKQSVLGSFLEEYSEKNTANNLQSVAVGKYGIRKREDIYSKELSADYSKNKVIHKDTLIIGMGSTQIDIGILVTDNCYCVSPAYTTYRIKGINSFYLQEYLIELNPLLSIRYMITSARQGKAVNKEDLMKHLMPIHLEHEQIEICHCFEKLYSRLRIEKEMLSTLQRQKAFLLQSMFI